MSDHKPSNPPLFYPDDERSCTRDRRGEITGAVPVLCTDITLRDLFAGLIMAQTLTCRSEVLTRSIADSGLEPALACARLSYHAADALLAERERSR